MKIAIVGAGFSPSEADRLRRAMATFKKNGDIHKFHDKWSEGIEGPRGYDADFAERCFKQIEGFGTYGFPESHAASFALLVYVSAWLKCHYPDVFACALLNSQPMGFYAPAQIVRDAREHGVEVRSPDVNHSDWDSTLEPLAPGPDGWPRHALRLGLRLVKGLRQEDAERLVAARARGRSLRRPARSVAPRRAGAGGARHPGARRCLAVDRARPAAGGLGGQGAGAGAAAPVRPSGARRRRSRRSPCRRCRRASTWCRTMAPCR